LPTIRRYRQAIAASVFLLTCIAVVYPLSVFFGSWALIMIGVVATRGRRTRAIDLAGCRPSEVEWYGYTWDARYGGWFIYSGVWFFLLPLNMPDSVSWQSVYDELFPVVPMWFVPVQTFFFTGVLILSVAIPLLPILIFPGVPTLGVAGSRLILLFAPPLEPRVIAVSDIVSMEWKHVVNRRKTKEQVPSYYRVTLSDGLRFLIFPNAIWPRGELMLKLQRRGLTLP
jgi:hypothetical protein